MHFQGFFGHEEGTPSPSCTGSMWFRPHCSFTTVPPQTPMTETVGPGAGVSWGLVRVCRGDGVFLQVHIQPLLRDTLPETVFPGTNLQTAHS